MTKRFSKKRWAKLLPQQQAVIQWLLDDTGSLELLARAGCGKTFTLMQAVDAIIEFGLGDCALMAFNKKIAEEIKTRLEARGIYWKIAQAGTVHSFGFKAWRQVAGNVVVDNSKIYNIVKSLENHSVKFCIFRECGDTIGRLTSLAKQRALGHLAPIEDYNQWLSIWDHFDLDNDVTEDIIPFDVITAAQQVYRKSLEMCRVSIDFDDMILAPLYFKARFFQKDHILLDESQDTNPARRALALAMLKPKTGRLLFVGDQAQAIYGFTGADNDSMDQLKEATSAKSLPLTVTMRCPKNIVTEAQKLVPDFTAHKDAKDGVVRSIAYAELEKEKLTKNDVILCRNTAPLLETAFSLISKGIACRVEGREIGQGLIKMARRWKIKDLSKLLDRLDEYQDRQNAKFMSKNQEHKVGMLADQIDCLRVVINRTLLNKRTTVDELVEDIEKMFGNTPDGQVPNVLTLSTVHKSKGREWKRVYIIGRSKYMPSPYAKKDWQIQQEKNLEYVAITRALEELIDVAPFE